MRMHPLLRAVVTSLSNPVNLAARPAVNLIRWPTASPPRQPNEALSACRAPYTAEMAWPVSRLDVIPGNSPLIDRRSSPTGSENSARTFSSCGRAEICRFLLAHDAFLLHAGAV